MIGDQDRRELAAIERRLAADDPALEHLLTHWPARHRRRPPASVAWAVAGFVTVIAGAAGLGAVLMLIGVAMLFASVVSSPLNGWTTASGSPWRSERPPR